MDGAMKSAQRGRHCKNAIAIINIVGGLIIGIAMHHMSALQAAKTYPALDRGGWFLQVCP